MPAKIVFVGAPRSGKSTLACEVYLYLKKHRVNAEFIPEWVRYDIQQNGPMASIWEQYRYLRNQKNMEDNIPPKVDVTICDAGTLSSYFYSCLYTDHLDSRQRLVLKDMYGELLDDLYGGRYDMIFRTPTVEVSNHDDGTRYQDSDALYVLERHMEMLFTQVHPVPNVISVMPSYDGRCEFVIQKIREHLDIGGLT